MKNLFTLLQRLVTHATDSTFEFALSEDQLNQLDSWDTFVDYLKAAASEPMEAKAETHLRMDLERDEWYEDNVNTFSRVMAVGYLTLILQLLGKANRQAEFMVLADRFLVMWDAFFTQCVVNQAAALLDATRPWLHPRTVIAQLESILGDFEMGEEFEALTQVASQSPELGVEVDDDEDEPCEFQDPILSPELLAMLDAPPASSPSLGSQIVPPDCDPNCCAQMPLSDDEDDEPAAAFVKRLLTNRFSGNAEPPAKRNINYEYDNDVDELDSSEEF